MVEINLESGSTHQRIRDAALELFGEKGYDGASMSDLAERVGIAKPSLYNYYRSKEELLLDLVDQGMALWTAACMAPFHRGGTFGRQLADHLRLSVDFARQRPHVVALFHLATTHVQGELSRRVETLVQQKESEIREVIHRRIVEGLETGELSAASAAGVHVFLGIFFHGLLFLQTNCGHEVGPLHDHLDEVWRFLYRGLTGREPSEVLSS